MKDETKIISGYQLVVCYIGAFIFMMGIIMLLPLLALFFFPSEKVYAINFIIPSVLCLVVGGLTYMPLKLYPHGNLEKQQGAVLVVMIWLTCIIVGTIPFLLTKNYTLIECLFEMTSGFSTTGLTIIYYDITPQIYLFYRSICEFVGGVGFILILTCIMSDRYGLKIYTSEGHSDRLLPNLAKSARLIFGIYCGYILVGAIAYTLCGMTFFDGLNHAMAAVSNGGFSTKAENIAYYSSWDTGFAIELISIALMVLGSINFLIHLYIITGKAKKVINHAETKFFLICAVPSIALMTFFGYVAGQTGFEGFRKSLFQLVTACTTTGFQTVSDFRVLGQASIYFMIILMIIGGGLGSAAGGLKQYRVVIALKSIYYSIRDSVSSPKVIRANYITQAGATKRLTDKEIQSTLSFITLWIVTLLVGSLMLSFVAQRYGFTLGDCIFEFTSALSGTGISIGIAATHNQYMLFILSIGMFLGRLEITVVLISLGKIVTDFFKSLKTKK